MAYYPSHWMLHWCGQSLILVELVLLCDLVAAVPIVHVGDIPIVIW